jgi:CheY-like chemotaxis protein
MGQWEMQHPESHVVTSKVNGTSLKVLVVDDNADAAQMLGMLLLAQGHEVLTVHDGPSTLDAAVDFRPDVVLLDIGLPGMDGYEVATRLRQQAIFEGLVLVAMTGYGQDSDRKRSHESGFDHHLVKPPDFVKLKEILAAASETRQSTGSRRE